MRACWCRGGRRPTRISGRCCDGSRTGSWAGRTRAWCGAIWSATGLSRAQLTRLVGRTWQKASWWTAARGRRGRRRKYRAPAAGRLHGTLSGPAMCERAWQVFGDARFERLAGISNGHLYNLRRSRAYELRMGAKAATRRAQVAIGERRRPRPGGRPADVARASADSGCLSHQRGRPVTRVSAGQRGTHSGVVPLPVLEGLLESFPFRVRGFHSDNGSEYVNYRVAELLEKLRIEEFTKSRPRRSNDALAESKNGAVMQALGYGHIAGRHAERLDQFNRCCRPI